MIDLSVGKLDFYCSAELNPNYQNRGFYGLSLSLIAGEKYHGMLNTS